MPATPWEGFWNLKTAKNFPCSCYGFQLLLFTQWKAVSDTKVQCIKCQESRGLRHLFPAGSCSFLWGRAGREIQIAMSLALVSGSLFDWWKQVGWVQTSLQQLQWFWIRNFLSGKQISSKKHKGTQRQVTIWPNSMLPTQCLILTVPMHHSDNQIQGSHNQW